MTGTQATDWYEALGYSPIAFSGSLAFVSGHTSIGENGHVVGDTAEAQASGALARIGKLLSQHGIERSDVVATRVYLRDVEDWEGPGRAHAAFFGDHRPALTMVGAKLVDARMLVEIEVVARAAHG